MKTLGRYQLLRKLARGRQCDVYLARRDEAGGFSREYVVKAMTRRLAGTGDAMRAFMREARVAGMLSHPNVAQTFDVDEDRGRYYMVIEHVPGRNLRALMASAALRRRTAPVDVAMTIAHGLASALYHAHMLGIVHRDVTPSNAMLSDEGYVKLLDWGSALAIEEQQRRTSRPPVATRYSSPELIRNEPVDPRADVYSLGVILFELVTGQRLFSGDDPIGRIAAGDIPKPSSLRRDIPPSLEAIITRSVSMKPDDRFHTAGDLELALETLATEHKLSMSSFRASAFMTGLFDDGPGAHTSSTSVPRNDPKTRIWLARRKRAG